MVSDETKPIKRRCKKMKKIVLLALLAIAFMVAPVFAAAPSADVNTGPLTQQYHSYDGLICTDCHTMHGSENGANINAGAGTGQWTGTGGFRELLYKGDWTDMCLSCHKQGYNTSATADLPSVVNSGWTAPIVMTLDGVDPANVSMPAGDFFYSNADPKKGHNPAYTKGSMATATSKLMAADTVLGSTPPGGSITDAEWSCHSCHGMHSRFSGSYTAWRQIKRKVNNLVTTGDVSGFGVETTAGGETQNALYEPIKSNSRGDIVGGVNNTNYVNLRKDLQALQGADLLADYSDTNKNVYQGGFSSFCSACHGAFHGTLTTEGGTDNAQTAGVWSKHPTNLEMGPVTGTRKYGITTYKAAVQNAQNTNPNPAGYDFRYPLVKADADFTVKSLVSSMTDSSTLANGDRLMCLTCHKAHASQYENMTRWDTNAHSFIANGATDFEGQVSTGDNPAYGCGKCHQKGGTKAYVKSF
jgi:cytochrome c553